MKTSFDHCNDIHVSAFPKSLRLVVAGASAGTLIEWYDFFLYGAVAALLAHVFFAGVPSSLAYLFSLLTFSAGFLVRPFGSLVFGSMGDKWGRKNTFVVTMALMGFATLAVGFIPSYGSIGIWAPVLLISTRLLQGLAVGGEYAGAATYVAEHAPSQMRGFATSFIQATCTIALMLALLAVILTRWASGNTAFEAWAWRIPFLASSLLIALSLWIRLKLDESALFKRKQEDNLLSRSPIRETFSSWRQGRLLFISTFCLTGGMTVIFYTSHWYVLSFMQKTLHLADPMASSLLAVALLIGSPAFIFFGWLSDKIGRRSIIFSAFVMAALAFYPLFQALSYSVNPDLMDAIRQAPVAITIDNAQCSGELNVLSVENPRTLCDALRRALADAGIPYRTLASTSPGTTELAIGNTVITAFPWAGSFHSDSRISDQVSAATLQAGYPKTADPRHVRKYKTLMILVLMVILVAMAYSPLAAMLVEIFPLRIRYTSLSFSYNLGVGWIGGLMPSIAYATVIGTGRMFSGLLYPMIIALLAFICGLFLVRETRGTDISI